MWMEAARRGARHVCLFMSKVRVRVGLMHSCSVTSTYRRRKTQCLRGLAVSNALKNDGAFARRPM